ncbi:tetratricopeptide repeat protein 21B-like isoform X3 [Ruditapes philippinarum]|uniref:tetratricopeptide repeat protein 21B-like isoform X3 n=1 Tax=Ruditapes philippinarum TaxID=129788 RepID=UPI00295B10A2|nr:tetratricopeptide repeat protein 21B-like isoform X3 [Ruditapes philippinarum]
MSDADGEILAKIHYYCREQYFCHMEAAADEGLKKFSNDSVLKFFRAYAMVLQDRVQEGIRELEILKDKRDVNLCSTMALMLAHKKGNSVDREAVTELDAKLKEERKQSGEMGLYYAGLFLFFTGKHDKAREYIDRMLKMNGDNIEGLVLKGWIELMSGREVKKASKFFDDAQSKDSGGRNIDGLFGKSKYYEAKHNYSGALESINQIIVHYSNFIPALVEKMRLQLCLQDWEATIETSQRALGVDMHCLEAMRYQALHLLCREGNYPEAASKLGDIITTMDRFESKNAFLYYNMAQVFCRMCGRNSLVLQQTYTLMERAVSLSSGNSDYITELGFQLLLQGKVKDAMRCYKNAMKIDETSVSALTGIIRCQLMEDQLEDAAQQLEFLGEIQQSIGTSADLLYLSAVLSMKRNKGPEKCLDELNKAIETHFKSLKGYPLGIQYYMILNPDFCLQIIKDYLLFAPQTPLSNGGKPVGPGQVVNPVLKKCNQVLDPLTRAVPGLLEALYLMGKVKYLSGDVDAAQSTLQHCIDVEPTYSDGHILMAQIHLQQNNFKLANQSLEVGLSHNFEVRDHPLYHLIKARIQKKQGDNEEAVRTLQMAMSLPGIKGNKPGSAASRRPAKTTIGVNDRVSVYLELAEAHRLLGNQHEAAKIMQDAINDFHGTPEEVRITISNADLSISRGDIESAITMLRNIGPNQPYFVQAREKMADIYLHHRKDKKLYASCYRELVDKNPSPHTCLLLGDAYMSIQEPEKAIEVYESALKKNPKDGTLASKIGQALVKTHNYGKAINYYEAALRSGGQSFLRYDLAELLLKLRQYDKAEKVLKVALEEEQNGELDIMMDHTKYMVLLAKVYEKSDRLEDAMLSLTKAREMQARVLKRVQLEQPDAVTAQKQLAADICCQMAVHTNNQRDYDKAITYYKEALVYNENDGKIMLDVAGLYLATGDLDACQHQLMTLLKNDKENDSATIMLADLMFRKNEYDSAMFHFQQLLQYKADNYEALSRLVDLMRRAGKLEEVPKFLELAENASPRAKVEAGFNYCKGLFEWYTGNPTSALKLFNMARKDSDWGNLATYNMVEICLNPDNDTIGGEAFESVEGDSNSTSESREKADSEQMAVRTAEKLLKELKPKPGEQRPKYLENMALIATKQKGNVEKALSNFMEMASDETRENVSALYGMAAAYMVLKQTPRARNQLKRVAKSNWTMQDAEDLEKSWLLLADIYIQSGKYDMSTELLKRVLQHNKSCCKGYEYQGFIMEKEQSYKDAAMSYENAWKYGNKNNPVIGYKLAFNYLKAKRNVDAIDICHHVLGSHPNYPKIKKEILDKARQSLRV